MQVATKPAGGYELVRADVLQRAWDLYKTGKLRLKDLKAWLQCLDEDGLEAGEKWVPSTGVKRRIPFPRRMLRYLAKKGKPSLIAAVFGHLMQCLFFTDYKCRSWGRCRASWVAETFQVDPRRIKAARAELVTLGWLIPQPEEQWKLNRWGGVFEIALDWGGLPPLRATLPPPDSDLDPRKGEKDQNLPDGDLSPKDLKDVAKVLEIGAKLVGDSEADRLRALAAAEHAAVGRNPGGLFMWLMKNRVWRFLTQQDEDLARVKLREHFFPARRPEIQVSEGRGSKDRAMASAVKLAARSEKYQANPCYRADPFLLMKQLQPDWTRERWNAALGAL